MIHQRKRVLVNSHLWECSKRRYLWPWYRGAGSCSKRPSGHVWKDSLRGDPPRTPRYVHPWSQSTFCSGKYSWQKEAKTHNDTNHYMWLSLSEPSWFIAACVKWSFSDLKLAISLFFAALKVFLVMPSPRSALSQHSQRKWKTCRVWRSCTVTLFIYLYREKFIIYIYQMETSIYT